MNRIKPFLTVVGLAGIFCWSFGCVAQGAGTLDGRELVIVAAGRSGATIVVSPSAGPWEKRAAGDLAHYIELISGAKVPVADTDETVNAAMKASAPLLVVGRAALAADASLMTALKRVAKRNPVLRADAIVVRRRGNRVYLAGLTDDGHYHAMVHLLHLWGCRWYLPTEFGQCIPRRAVLKVDTLDHAYASPFERRAYWISWDGDRGVDIDGLNAFNARNFMTFDVPTPGIGHALNYYTKDLVTEGQTGVPIAEEKTIAHVAAKLEDVFKNNGGRSLAMEDGSYRSDSPVDRRLEAGLFDKYFMEPSITDAFMTFYNGVCARLLRKYPSSTAKIGFLAYMNTTLPPQQVKRAAKPLICALAPIDIDPIHGMDDPRSPPRQEYRQILYRWAQVMEGRVLIYDYDQGMLVWRDLPNPSHQAFRQDVKHYRKAGIIGFYTESRLAIATTFLNLHMRGQLMWNPDLDVEAHLAEFYEKFYGPASKPMARYWNAIFKAWQDTIVTEHEFFIAPVIYTPRLVESLRGNLDAAEKLVEPLATKKQPSRNEALYLERMKFTRLGFNIIDQYIAMVRAAATECDYRRAHEIGQRGLKMRLELDKMNPTFISMAYETNEAWWPSEVALYDDMARYTDGTKGKLVTKLPLEWSFRRDPNDTGLASGWAYRPVDLSYWRKHKSRYSRETRKDYPTTEWEMLRTDLYMQAQGVLHPDRQSFKGFAWYRTPVDLSDAQAKRRVHVLFPGLFGESWLYVNGTLVAHREQNPKWYHNDYTYNWNVDLGEHVKPGRNTLTLRVASEHHVSGMFRRPFLYYALP